MPDPVPLGPLLAQHKNLLTADEAAQRKCRAVGVIVHTHPLQAASWSFPSCSGPACMHWRWGWAKEPDTINAQRGYCGLGGGP